MICPDRRKQVTASPTLGGLYWLLAVNNSTLLSVLELHRVSPVPVKSDVPSLMFPTSRVPSSIPAAPPFGIVS
jgi:hypothetical protein